MDFEAQVAEKPTTSKAKKLSHRNKKKNYFEFTNEEKKIIEKLNNEIVPFEENIYSEMQSINKNKNGLNPIDVYKISPNTTSNFIQEESTSKDDKNYKKINSKKKYKNLKYSSVKTDSTVPEENNAIIKKLRNLLIKLDSIYQKNILNKYYQRWLLQTFDIEEEEYSDIQNEEKNRYEEEEDEVNDYRGDLEEIEERAADEEESVITSVQSKARQKRTNDILFALRKIFKYKNIFFRYFIRWYNAVDINAPANEYKKMRKGKKITPNSINNLSGKKNSGNLSSSLNNSNNSKLKNPIYEVPSEEKIDDAKTNLKNFIEFKGNKRSILKKYYDIWYNLTFNQANDSDSNNNEQNEYIFTYHGKYRNASDNGSKQNLTNENIFDRYNESNQEEKHYDDESEDEESNSRTQIVNRSIDNITIKSKQNTQYYIRKKIYSIQKESIEKVKKSKGNKNKKKKDKLSGKLRNTLDKINNKNLLFLYFRKWAKIALNQNEEITKVIFKNKQSMKIKKKNLGSRNKTKNQNQLLKSCDNNNNDSSLIEEKGHRKNNLSIDIKKIKDKRINPFIEEEQMLAESLPVISPKHIQTFNIGQNAYQVYSDNSVNNSINTNSNSVNEIFDQIKETKENAHKKAKKLKGEGIKKLSKNKKENINNNNIANSKETASGLDPEKIKKMVEKIRRTHRNKKGQRFLLIKPPKVFKKIQEKKKDDRESFSSINYSLKLEKFKKKLFKLILKTTCRKNPLMHYFDEWFNKTYCSDDYIPFLRKVSSTSTLTSNNNIDIANGKASKAKKLKRNKKSNEDKNKKVNISVDNIDLNNIKGNKINKKDKNDKNDEDKSSNNENLKKNNSLTDSYNSIQKEGGKGKKGKDINLVCVNNINTGIEDNKIKREASKFAKINDLLNMEFDSESSDNKLLFNEKKKNVFKGLSESCEMPRKKSVGTKKNNINSKLKLKNKENKGNKTKKEKAETEEKIEEGPSQRKPGNKKVQFVPENEGSVDSEKKPKKGYLNSGRDSKLDLDAIQKVIQKKSEQTKKKKKRQNLSASVDITIKKKKKSHKIKELNDSEGYKIKKKSKDDDSRAIKLPKGIKDYFRYSNISKEEDEINPDVQNIEITQADDSGREKKHKKSRKEKKNKISEGNNDEENDNNNNNNNNNNERLIKKYKRALHVLRKAIRSYQKRNKTFNPDYELKNAFDKWVSLTFNNENEEEEENNEDKNEINMENVEDFEEKKKNALKNVIDLINIHNKKIKGRLSEDEENYNYIKYCYNIWFDNTFKLKEEEDKNKVIINISNDDIKNYEEETIDIVNTNMNEMDNGNPNTNNINRIENDYKDENDNENKIDNINHNNNDNDYKNENENDNGNITNENHIENENEYKNEIIEKQSERIDDSSIFEYNSSKINHFESMNNLESNKIEKPDDVLIEKKESIFSEIDEKIENKDNKEKIEEKKPKKYIEAEGLLDIEFSQKKVKKHKVKKKRGNNSATSSNKKEKEKEEKEKGINKKNKEEIKKNINNILTDNNKEQTNNEKEKEKDEKEKKEKEEKEKEKKEKDEKEKEKEKEKENIPKSDSKDDEIRRSKSKTEQNIFQKLKKEFPIDDENENNSNIEDSKNKKNINEEENNETPRKIISFPKVMPLLINNGKLNLPPPQNINSSLSYREYGKEKFIKPESNTGTNGRFRKYYKRSLAYSSSYILYSKRNISQQEDNNLDKSTNLKNNPTEKILNLQNIEEINVKLSSIFQKRDGGLYIKRKYFDIWKEQIYNFKLAESKSDPILNLDETMDFDNINKNNNNDDNNKDKDKNKIEIDNDKINNNHSDKKEYNNKEEKSEANNENNNIVENDKEEKEEKEEINKEKENAPPSETLEKPKDEEEEEEEEANEIEEIENIFKVKNNKFSQKNKINRVFIKPEENTDKNPKIEKANEEKINLNNNNNNIHINNINNKKLNINNNNNNIYISKNRIFNKVNSNKINKISENKELELDPKEKEKNLRNIFSTIKKVNKTHYDAFNRMKNIYINKPNYESITERYTKLLDEHNQRVKAYQLFLFYAMFNENNKYYLKRNSFIKWRRNNKIFRGPFNKKHIKSNDDHCVSCTCYEENNIFGNVICLDCKCNEMKNVLKNLIIKHKFMKELNPLKYYLHLWNRITVSRH